MNAESAHALYDAERNGVPQITGTMTRGAARCALGVLYDAGLTSWWYREPVACPACGEGEFEIEDNLIVHLSDHHRMTFSEIARKLGPDTP